MNDNKLNIAVVGAGVAGITASHILQRKHNVALFEKNNYIGGHTNTIVIENGPDKGAPIDTGFIVLNDRTYPTFHKLLSQLNVGVRNSDMSFGFHCERTGLEYAGSTLKRLFAQKKNLFNPAFLRMLYDIRRFGKQALKEIKAGKPETRTLGEYVLEHGYSQAFVHDYLLPMGAAIWSTPTEKMLDFPASAFLAFFDNHGLLALNMPQWQTVSGGSHAYVKAFRDQFKGTIHGNRPIRRIKRNERDVAIHFDGGISENYDRVVLACHADEALRLLDDPTDNETKLLGAWRYNVNEVVLHTDSSVMPKNHHAWASWNYTRERTKDDSEPLSLTYHMNRLQGLKTEKDYFATLNRVKPVHPADVVKTISYAHPIYDFQSVATQPELPSLNCANTYFCGSYFGYGFHEDAVKSGAAAAKHFGLAL